MSVDPYTHALGARAGQRQHGTNHNNHAPPRSLLILPLLAILTIVGLVFSELEYLLPISRLLQIDVTLPTGVSKRADEFWLLPPQQAYFRRKDKEEDANKIDTEASQSDQSHDDEQSKPTLNRIVLLGERHSGTSYTTRMLAKCFPSLEVDDFLVRYKHWFQPTPDQVVNVSKTHLQNDKHGMNNDEDMHKILDRWPKIASLQNPKSAFNTTLVITMFRNAYDWLEAMRLGPHHMPNHFGMYKFVNAPVPDTSDNPWFGSNFSSWQDFLHANMTIGGNATNSNTLCQNAYSSQEVSPCRVSKDVYPNKVKQEFNFIPENMPDDLPFNAHNPIYELHENGEPFQNPLELRTAKIYNFMQIPNTWDVGGFMILQHEDVNTKGSGFLLDKVSKLTGMQPSCGADAPKNQGGRTLEKEWQEWISEHADWKAEGMLGYTKRE